MTNTSDSPRTPVPASSPLTSMSTPSESIWQKGHRANPIAPNYGGSTGKTQSRGKKPGQGFIPPTPITASSSTQNGQGLHVYADDSTPKIVTAATKSSLESKTMRSLSTLNLPSSSQQGIDALYPSGGSPGFQRMVHEAQWSEPFEKVSGGATFELSSY